MANNNKLEKVVKFLAWTDVVVILLQIFIAIYALVAVSLGINNALKTVDVKADDSVQSKIGLGVFLVMKIFYFVILFLIAEALLACYLLRAVTQRRLDDLRVWLIVSCVCAALYITDFISTLHALSMVEDFPVSLSIFVKVPLLILVYRLYKQLSEHGEHLINEV